MRILVAFGTRPEIIKLAPVCRALKRADVELDVFWSGQHIELAAGVLDLFDIAFADAYLDATAVDGEGIGVARPRFDGAAYDILSQ